MRLRAASLLAVFLALLPAACARKPAPAAAAKEPAKAAPEAPAAPAVPTAVPLPYEAAQGRATFQHYCQTCHGETGAGDGFNAFNLDPRPRDLSDPDFQKKKSDADLADTVRRGGSGVGLSALMPPWGHTLSARQVDEVVRYVRTLRKPAS